jgi:hypothetical protein
MDEFVARSNKASTRKVSAMQSERYDKLKTQKLLETTSDYLRTVMKNGGAFTRF